ncbi:MAG TPA: hypothetical protein VHY37_09100 [Tepidisphaeraceae bacterium]|jgi:hypothetical protein|nr:hypothetical protein [Tepidisphaeraceae bacterium]
MKPHPILLMYLARRAIAPTLVGAAVLAAYVLWPAGPLTGRDVGAALIVVADAAWLAISLSRSGKGEMGFLYTRGFRWDTIWWHRVIVGAIAGFLVIAAVFATLWLGLRTGVQMALGNPLYPLVARRETWAPMTWLGLYGLAFPVGLYSAVRWDSGVRYRRLAPAVAVFAAVLCAASVNVGAATWFGPTMRVLGVIVALILLWAGERLHREVEVP